MGCYAWSADKVGRDVGELSGIGPIGIAATADVDELCRILTSGANVVATAGFISGHALGEGRDRILAACAEGNSSIFGSGMNPGFANLLGLVSAGLCDRVDSITVLESVDSTGYDSPDTERSIGYGRPIDDPALPAMTAAGTAVFGDAVHLMADALGLTLDEVRCDTEYARTTADLDLETWPIEHGYVVEVEGRPTVRTKLEVFPPPDFVATSFVDFMVLGMIMTAMPAVNAIHQVCDAAPGIVTYLDLPLVLPRGRVA